MSFNNSSYRQSSIFNETNFSHTKENAANPGWYHKLLDIFGKCTTEEYVYNKPKYYNMCCRNKDASKLSNLRKARCYYANNDIRNEETETVRGGSHETRRRKPKGGRKWSLKYKKSINCKKPHGFSQKQFCKYK